MDNAAHAKGGAKEAWVDGQVQIDRVIRLADDGREHAVRVALG